MFRTALRLIQNYVSCQVKAARETQLFLLEQGNQFFASLIGVSSPDEVSEAEADSLYGKGLALIATSRDLTARFQELDARIEEADNSLEFWGCARRFVGVPQGSPLWIFRLQILKTNLRYRMYSFSFDLRYRLGLL